MELFAKPGVGGIIKKCIDGVDYILIQDRYKDDAESEAGLVEIPAGKIREFENIFDCLRREIREETGLTVTYIEGENQAAIFESNDYKVLDFTPFSSAQNIQGSYPIMVHTFICQAEGELLNTTNETKNIGWISLTELNTLLQANPHAFYPMHVIALQKYLKQKQSNIQG